VPNRRPQLEFVAPSASPEEAAAVIVEAAPKQNPWQRAALLEATGREPDGPSPWGDPVPWG
jgi:hypothetical protein